MCKACGKGPLQCLPLLPCRCHPWSRVIGSMLADSPVPTDPQNLSLRMRRSYGKGLIQSVYQLEDGSALIMTVGKYLTPSLIDIDRQGIVPDFARLPTPESAMSRLAQCQAPGLVPA